MPSPCSNKYQEYLHLAEAARRSAFRATDIEAKKSFEKLADGWQRLAEQVLRVANSSDGNK
jgi:hypothetical protein